MYKKIIYPELKLRGIKSETGEPLEIKLKRIKHNKEPITDGAEPIYTERKDGVKPELDIRTDKFELATDAMDKASKNHRLKRTAYQQAAEQDPNGNPQEQG